MLLPLGAVKEVLLVLLRYACDTTVRDVAETRLYPDKISVKKKREKAVVWENMGNKDKHKLIQTKPTSTKRLC